MPGLRSEAAISRSKICPSIRRATSSPSAVCTGARACCPANAAEASTNATTTADHCGASGPAATAAGTRPSITLVPMMNSTGRAPSARLQLAVAITRPHPARGTNRAICQRFTAAPRIVVGTVRIMASPQGRPQP